MITQPKVLERDSNEYFQLKVTCQIFEELTEDMHFKVENIYFDMGQNWMWTTVVAYNDKKDSSFQALDPRAWKEIINDATNSQIRNICKETINEYPSIWNIKESK